MADVKTQSYANHAKYVPGYHFVLGTLVLAYLVVAIWHLIQQPGLASVMGLMGAFILIGLFWYCRIFPLKVQDRVIQLEERLRLERLLPEDLRGRLDELSPGSYIGLRFASDGELEELTRALLSGEVRGRKAIKERVKAWRADHRRL